MAQDPPISEESAPAPTPAESVSNQPPAKVAFTEVVTENPPEPEKKDDPPAPPNETTKPSKTDKSRKKKKKSAPSVSSSSSSSSSSSASSDSGSDSDASSASNSNSDTDASSSSSSSSSSSDSDSDDELNADTSLIGLKPKMVKSVLKQRKKDLARQMKDLEKSLAQAEKRAEKEKLKKAEKKASKEAAKATEEEKAKAAAEKASSPTDPNTASAEKEITPNDAVSSTEKKTKSKDKKKRKKQHKAALPGLDSLEVSLRRHRASTIGSQDPDAYKSALESSGLGKKEKVLAKASVLDFARVDKRYNKSRFTFEIVDSSNAPTIDKYRQYVFTVRRIFDWENKYVNSKVDIKSRSLKELLRRAMGEIKGISLVEDTPSIDPNMLFNYVKEMETEIQRLEGVIEKKKLEEGKVEMIKEGDTMAVEKTEVAKSKDEKIEDSTSTVTAVKDKSKDKPDVKDEAASKPDDKDTKKKSKKDKKDKKGNKTKNDKSSKSSKKDKKADKKDKKDKKEAKLREPPVTSENIVAHGKVLLRYLEEDFKSIKSSLVPLLSAGLITFDLLWAVFKPNTLVYTVCPGTDEPRAFIVEYTEKNSSLMRGTWFSVEGRYLEFVGLPEDHKKGKIMQVTETGGKGGFGWGNCTVEIDSFTGSRRVDSLRCYPMSYREDQEEMKKRLIERGKKFVSLAGMQYKRHKGLAFMRNKKGQIVKVNLNGRIMIDPALFRRLNPNYIVSSVRPRSADVKTARDLNIYTSDKNGRFRRVGEDSDSESDDEEKCGCGESDDEGVEKEEEEKEDAEKFFFDENGKLQVYNPEELASRENNAETIGEGMMIAFTDHEYMLASSVVLGFSFPEKLWLEISVAGVQDIEWNDSAFDTLVLPPSQKEIVKALVETHTGSRMESTTIDDIIQGKGRGLVSVLHGPPGTGKTLTAESIAELLHKPLYMVSSGELGTSAHILEDGLNRILDIAHTWDAVLLLDEADVFLEKRTMHDLHRNALVSVFLRLLEYFQGILFLTTNRVQSFDEAFQSRIHVALRYDDLTFSAKKQIWQNFIVMVRAKERSNGLAAIRAANQAEEQKRRELKKIKAANESSASSSSSRRSRTREESPRGDEILTDSDVNMLAAKPFNGRQIKNIVRTAQSLAASKNMPLGITHIKQVIAVAESFDNDLKGGTGYIENMRSYA